MAGAKYPIEMVNGVPVVAAPAEIDATNANWMAAVLLHAAACGHGKWVVDMTGTQFCASAGVNVLVQAHNPAVAAGGELRLVVPASAMVLRVFAIVGIDQLIPTFTSLEQALEPAPGGVAGPAGAGPLAARAAAADRDAAATAALYTAYYRSLVRQAAPLVRDRQTAEDVVQDAFLAMHANWCTLRDPAAAAWYLRQCVVNRSRSVLRHRAVAGRQAQQPLLDMPSAEELAFEQLERSAVIAALRTLAPRQREALVLRYYADLSGPQIAAVMGISIGAVKRHTARALSALGRTLKGEACASAHG